MFLSADRAVPQQVYLRAKHYLEQRRIPFFDFYRNCAFGFIRVAEKKGYYTHLVIEETGHLVSYCNCQEADLDEACAHGFALFLKMTNWPFTKENLSASFEKFPLCDLFRRLGSQLPNRPFNPTTNPRLVLDDTLVEIRYANYWDFSLDESSITRRDRQCREKAVRLCRSRGEKEMLKKNFPSAKVRFEESQLYSLCKLLFHLDRTAGLAITAKMQPEHQVLLRIAVEGKEVFSWLLSIETFLKGIQDHREYWLDRADFQVRRQGVAPVYRISFTPGNELEVEPKLALGGDTYIGLDEVSAPNLRNLCFHENLGYFRIQTGLSPFEMEYANAGVTTVGHAQVTHFLAQHQETLQGLDRRLMDESLFGESVVENFQNFRLDLLDFVDGKFSYRLECQLAGHVFDNQAMRQLFDERGRYRKLAGLLFDTGGYDAVYLRPLFEDPEDETLDPADLFRMMTFFRGRLETNTNELTEKVYQDLRAFEMPDSPSLVGTKLDLRPYQDRGYEWLFFLYSYGLGGLLCDQMGLGKTHQGMALVAAILKLNPEASILVVAPASVIYHWRDKLAVFCPDITTGIHHGNQRDGERTLSENRVMITTYATLRNDADQFQPILFDLILFDEVQFLKNKMTKGYRNIHRLNARSKIGLTGTPIENQISELKSLFDLVFRGYLGTDAHFKRYFSDPITNFGSELAKESLKEIVAPFILRRAKSQVLRELPDKTEDLRNLVLGPYEQELYLEVKQTGKKGIASGTGKSSYTHIFQLINKLKQICNHPALYFGEEDYQAFPCAKWEMFTELLRESLDSGEKIVVFTQYLGMVAMIAKYLRNEGVGYASITGATKDRDSQQKAFMEQDHCRVFIGTIGAAGVGIDLTAASIAIHYDRWWNPAREEQATDRIHRIGQKKNVQVYKFKVLKTVEERIDAIIEKKRSLLKEVIDFDNEHINKSFNLDELLKILG